ncbi:MAG: single-stranded DNA-binding protein [Vulcanibacillus sp.]
MLSVALLGRLVFDVEVKEVGENKDKKVLNNRLAVSIGKDKTTFIDMEAWGNTAEIIEKYYVKGNEILVEGQLINKTRKKEEVEYEVVSFLVDKIMFTYGNKKKEELAEKV